MNPPTGLFGDFCSVFDKDKTLFLADESTQSQMGNTNKDLCKIKEFISLEREQRGHSELSICAGLPVCVRALGSLFDLAPARAYESGQGP